LDKFSAARSEDVTVDYFRTMKIPLVRGREFTELDNNGAPQVVIVNQAFVRKFFPGEDPLGKRINRGAPFIGGLLPWETIIGLVADTKNHALDAPTQPEFYTPHLQHPFWPLAMILRTGVDPGSLAAAVRNEIWAVDKDMPVYDVSTMNQIISGTLSQRRFSLLLLSLFSILALLLTAAGVYGVMSYSVTQRSHEIGIRMSLGAGHYDIMKTVVGRGMALAFAGAAFGVVAALALTRVIASLLFNIKETDAVTFIATSGLLLGVALAANLIPARRATKVDPLNALRYE